MSFWDNVRKITHPYGEDEYDDYEDGMEDFEEEAPRSRRSSNANAEDTSSFGTESTSSSRSSSFSGQVLNINSNKQEVVLFRPSNFDDRTAAADDLRSKKAIIVNLENVDTTLARRVVDFLSGCAYSLDGQVTKIAFATYLFSPNSMDVTGTLENLQIDSESYV